MLHNVRVIYNSTFSNRKKKKTVKRHSFTTISLNTHAQFFVPAAGNGPGTSPAVVILRTLFRKKKLLTVSGLSDPGDNLFEAPLVEYVLSSLLLIMIQWIRKATEKNF